MGAVPEPLCLDHGVDTVLEPPGLLVTRIMQRPVVGGTEGYGPLIARFSAESTDLGETDVMCLGRRPTTDQARLIGDQAKVILVAHAARALHSETKLSALAINLIRVSLA